MAADMFPQERSIVEASQAIANYAAITPRAAIHPCSAKRAAFEREAAGQDVSGPAILGRCSSTSAASPIALGSRFEIPGADAWPFGPRPPPVPRAPACSLLSVYGHSLVGFP